MMGMGLIGNSVLSIDNEKFEFLLNDLTAASWVLSADVGVADCTLVGRFMEIHKVFLDRLGRKERGALIRMPAEKLSEIVRGWILLYKCTLSELRKQFPRTNTSTDMILYRVNWSERLKISASGLLIIDHSSRYAEYWAERSVKTKYGYHSLNSRLSFIGGPVYAEYARMVRNGDLLVLDGFSNGVTSYDMMLFIRETGCSPASFLSEIKNKKWRVERGYKDAIDRIFELYANLSDNDLHVPVPN